MNIIIAGSRSFSDYPTLKNTCDRILKNLNPHEITIVSGTARGADRLGERYANEHGYPIKRFPAQWDKLGKSAGVVRNAQMADFSDTLIAFWNGSSPGTRLMIKMATDRELIVHVITPYDTEPRCHAPCPAYTPHSSCNSCPARTLPMGYSTEELDIEDIVSGTKHP